MYYKEKINKSLDLENEKIINLKMKNNLGKYFTIKF
jgi:hypothetical protein